MTLAGTTEYLVGLWFENQKFFKSTIIGETRENRNLELFDKVRNWLDEYFLGKNPAISKLMLSPSGSDFRQSVWKILCKIPYGRTTTYGKIACEIAKKRNKKVSAQAIGNAVAHNPISIIIPCHRVIGANGNLTGYAGGIDKKIQLLKHEDADVLN